MRAPPSFAALVAVRMGTSASAADSFQQKAVFANPDDSAKATFVIGEKEFSNMESCQASLPAFYSRGSIGAF